MPKGSKSIDQLITRLSELELEQQQIIKDIVEHASKSNKSGGHKKCFKPGDRVSICNHVTGKQRKLPTDADRIGTVTKVTTSRVLFTTDSGFKTWRADKNLKLHEDDGEPKRRAGRN